MRGKGKANPWPINLAMDLFNISKEEFQNPEIINHWIFCNLETIKKFKDLTAEAVIDLFDQNSSREERIKKIIISYYKDNKTLKSIGEEYGISAGRVRQIRMKGLSILRVRLKAEV